MVDYMIKAGVHEPYTIPNKGPTPKIDREEGLPPGGLDIAWVEPWRKNLYHWDCNLKWFERLHAHATMNSARRNVKCVRPYAPRDELDFVLDAVYCPNKDAFNEKTDPYLQVETVHGDDYNLSIYKKRVAREEKHRRLPITLTAKALTKMNRYRPAYKFDKETWRVLKNRIAIYPDRPVPKDFPITFSDGGVEFRDSIYHVKLGIRADHSPQTNPGYSRTPCGAFYSI